MLPTPEKAVKVLVTTTRVGGVVRFECKEKGYEIHGSKIRTCQNDGFWSGIPASCESKYIFILLLSCFSTYTSVEKEDILKIQFYSAISSVVWFVSCSTYNLISPVVSP